VLIDTIPPDTLDKVSIPLLDGASYSERLEYFRNKTELAMSNTFLFVGHGCSMKVVHDALCLSPGSARGEKNEPIMLYRGIHTVKQIVFLSSSGFVTLDAFRWCSQQGISIALMDTTGCLMYSFTPETATRAELRRLQYRACGTDTGVSIARDLVYRKTIAQIGMLKTLAERKYKRIFKIDV
jgi:CRISPR/Cas system-associated endonuclease Cas1